MVMYLSFGSLGITFFRLLYVKVPNFVKYDVGEKNLLFLIGFGGLITAILWTIGFGIGNLNSRPALNICIGSVVTKIADTKVF